MTQTSRAKIMQIVGYYVTLIDGTEIEVQQTGRMLIDLHHALGWEGRGESKAPPLEVICWCTWWQIHKQSHKLAPNYDNHLNLADDIKSVEINLEQEGLR